MINVSFRPFPAKSGRSAYDNLADVRINAIHSRLGAEALAYGSNGGGLLGVGSEVGMACAVAVLEERPLAAVTAPSDAGDHDTGAAIYEPHGGPEGLLQVSPRTNP